MNSQHVVHMRQDVENHTLLHITVLSRFAPFGVQWCKWIFAENA